MSIGKRIGVIIIAIFEAVFLWLPQELDNLYNTRLGFMRQILFMNESYPVQIALYFVIILLVISVLLIIFWGMRLGKSKSKKVLRYLWLFFLSVTIFIYMLIPNNIADPLYYYNLASLGIALLLQLVVVTIIRERLRRK